MCFCNAKEAASPSRRSGLSEEFVTGLVCGLRASIPWSEWLRAAGWKSKQGDVAAGEQCVSMASST